MKNLFDEPQEPKGKEESTLTETLAELETHKGRLMEELGRLGEDQRHLVSRVRAIEKQQKRELEGVEEHIAEEPLSHEDMEKWVSSVFWQFARTMPGNPHTYAHSRWCDRAMFERVVRFIREHGYEQKYGNGTYVCYDVGSRFIWTMGAPVSETILINAKPTTMKPQEDV